MNLFVPTTRYENLLTNKPCDSSCFSPVPHYLLISSSVAWHLMWLACVRSCASLLMFSGSGQRKCIAAGHP